MTVLGLRLPSGVCEGSGSASTSLHPIGLWRLQNTSTPGSSRTWRSIADKIRYRAGKIANWRLLIPSNRGRLCAKNGSNL